MLLDQEELQVIKDQRSSPLTSCLIAIVHFAIVVLHVSPGLRHICPCSPMIAWPRRIARQRSPLTPCPPPHPDLINNNLMELGKDDKFDFIVSWIVITLNLVILSCIVLLKDFVLGVEQSLDEFKRSLGLDTMVDEDTFDDQSYSFQQLNLNTNSSCWTFTTHRWYWLFTSSRFTRQQVGCMLINVD